MVFFIGFYGHPSQKILGFFLLDLQSRLAITSMSSETSRASSRYESANRLCPITSPNPPGFAFGNPYRTRLATSNRSLTISNSKWGRRKLRHNESKSLQVQETKRLFKIQLRERLTQDETAALLKAHNNLLEQCPFDPAKMQETQETRLFASNSHERLSRIFPIFKSWNTT